MKLKINFSTYCFYGSNDIVVRLKTKLIRLYQTTPSRKLRKPENKCWLFALQIDRHGYVYYIHIFSCTYCLNDAVADGKLTRSFVRHPSRLWSKWLSPYRCLRRPKPRPTWSLLIYLRPQSQMLSAGWSLMQMLSQPLIYLAIKLIKWLNVFSIL